MLQACIAAHMRLSNTLNNKERGIIRCNSKVKVSPLKYVAYWKSHTQSQTPSKSRHVPNNVKTSLDFFVSLKSALQSVKPCRAYFGKHWKMRQPQM